MGDYIRDSDSAGIGCDALAPGGSSDTHISHMGFSQDLRYHKAL